jgi:hypothetical protein
MAWFCANGYEHYAFIKQIILLAEICRRLEDDSKERSLLFGSHSDLKPTVY